MNKTSPDITASGPVLVDEPTSYTPLFVCQPFVMDPFNVVRFRENCLAKTMFKIGWIDLNLAGEWLDLIPLTHFAEFWQILGYSVSGWGGLTFVDAKARLYFDWKAMAFAEEHDPLVRSLYPSPSTQPIENKDGVPRYRANGVLKSFYDLGIIDLNQLRNWPIAKDYPEDFNQILQMLGWPVGSKDFKPVRLLNPPITPNSI